MKRKQIKNYDIEILKVKENPDLCEVTIKIDKDTFKHLVKKKENDNDKRFILMVI